MPQSKPVLTHVTYRPKKGKEDELFSLVKRHWSVLRKVGLATDEPATVYRAADKKSGNVYFIEIFSWKDEQASSLAHKNPEVMSIWASMGPVLEGGDPQLAVLERVTANA